MFYEVESNSKRTFAFAIQKEFSIFMQFETMIGLIYVRWEIQKSLFHLDLTMLLKSRNLQQLFIIEIEIGFLARFQHLLYGTCCGFQIKNLIALLWLMIFLSFFIVKHLWSVMGSLLKKSGLKEPFRRQKVWFSSLFWN